MRVLNYTDFTERPLFESTPSHSRHHLRQGYCSQRRKGLWKDSTAGEDRLRHRNGIPSLFSAASGRGSPCTAFERFRCHRRLCRPTSKDRQHPGVHRLPHIKRLRLASGHAHAMARRPREEAGLQHQHRLRLPRRQPELPSNMFRRFSLCHGRDRLGRRLLPERRCLHDRCLYRLR